MIRWAFDLWVWKQRNIFWTQVLVESAVLKIPESMNPWRAQRSHFILVQIASVWNRSAQWMPALAPSTFFNRDVGAYVYIHVHILFLHPTTSFEHHMVARRIFRGTCRVCVNPADLQPSQRFQVALGASPNQQGPTRNKARLKHLRARF